jgi:hypothetical protein
MEHTTVTLALEEVTYLVAAVGGVNAARDFWATVFGPIANGVNLADRLATAGHTLLSRGYIAASENGDGVEVDATVQRFIRGLLECDYAIQYRPRSATQITTYLFRGADIVRHRLRDGLINEFGILEEARAIPRLMADDLQLHADAADSGEALATMGVDVLKQIAMRQNPSGTTDVPAELVAELPNADLIDVLRLERREAGLAVRCSALIIRAPEHSWIFAVDNGGQTATLYRGSEETLQKIVDAPASKMSGDRQAFAQTGDASRGKH